MKRAILGLAFLMGSTILSAQFSIGVRIGEPPPPRVVRVHPRSPGPGYVWVDGYWYPNGRRYVWHDGYWTRPPYGSARWIGPRYEGGLFYEGYWDGDRGPNRHDHRWDRDRRNRDYDRVR